MKLAVPSTNAGGFDAGISDPFAECRFVTLVTVEGMKVEKNFETIEVPEGTDLGELVFTLLGKGTAAVIAGKLTERERLAIAGSGMKVFVGARGTVWDAVRSYTDDRLEDMSEINPCESRGGCHG